MKRLSALVAMLLVLAGGGMSQAVEPTKVTVGLYVVRLSEPEFKSGTFEAVFWIWFRWKGDKDLNPVRKFEVYSGQVESLDNELSEELGEEHYQIARVRATVVRRFDLSRFPFDRHELTLCIEETDEGLQSVVYEPDMPNTTVDRDLRLEGWVIGDVRFEGGVKMYASNFGDTTQSTDAQSAYSRVTMFVPVRRPGLSYPFKLFWSIQLSVLVAFLAFLIKPEHLDPRFGLGIGALFAAMASAYVITSNLPDGNQTTVADSLVMWSIGFIVLSIVQSILSLRFTDHDRVDVSRRLDRASFVAMTTAYAGVNVLLFV